MTLPPPAAVLWDMDGTLVDTEPYWIAGEVALAADAGVEWTEADSHAQIGNPLLATAENLARRGVPMSPEAIVDELLRRVIAAARERLPWRPGARELLEEVAAAGIPCALVTMSYRSLAQVVLEQTPSGAFSVLVAGDEVTHGKPHPEAYLTAATRLGVDPRDCVAIEDSATGAASAEAAGVPTLAVEYLQPLPLTPGQLKLDTLQGVGLADLPRLRAEILARPAA
ncbi:MAG: HAD family phosphatase [Kineosporiaceae bacterium]